MSCCSQQREVSINVRGFGAKGDGVTDDSAAFAAMIAQLKSVGGAGYIPAGDYLVSGVDLSDDVGDFSKSITLYGDGRWASNIIGTTNGGIVVDMTGRNYAALKHLSIRNAAGVVPQTGLLLARSEDSGNCNNNLFTEVNVLGNFSVASAISLAAESTKWANCRFENQNSTSKRCFYTSTGNNDDLGLTYSASTLIQSVNTDNRMFGCEFYMVQDGGGEIVVFDHSATYALFGCTVVIGTRTGTNKLVVFKDSSDTVFTGMVELHGCQLEGGGAGVIPIYFDCNGRTQTFEHIKVIGGNFVLFDDACRLFDYDRDGVGNAYLKNFVFESPKINVISKSYLYGCVDSRIKAAITDDAPAMLAISDLVVRSDIVADDYRGATVQVQSHQYAYSDGTPDSGTVGQGLRIINATPVDTDPSEWVVKDAGTFGTLSGVTASGATGEYVVEVNTLDDLEEGHKITIAGVSGILTAIKIDGTTVTVRPALDATVSGAAVSFAAPTLMAVGSFAA